MRGWAKALGWAAWAVSVILVIASFPLIVANRDAPIQSLFGNPALEALFMVVFLSMPTVGLVLAARHPENSVGWLLLLGGPSFAFSIFSNEYAIYALLTNPGALPGGTFMAWASSTWSWIPGMGLLAASFLLFPTGRLPSARWRPLLIGIVAATGVLLVSYSLRPGPFDRPWNSVDNPYAPAGPLGDAMTALAVAGNAIVALALVLGAGSLVQRYRQASGIERQQIKWFAFAATLLALYVPFAYAFILISPIDFLFVPLSLLGILIFMSVPAAVGIAILRYRLYDIDLLINRTAVYTTTTAAVALTFSIGIVALQPVLRPLTEGSELAVAASTLVSFAIFQPVRRRMQTAIDRRFDRARFDAARTVDAFAERLRDEVDLDALTVDLIGAVEQTMAPAHISMWLRGRAG